MNAKKKEKNQLIKVFVRVRPMNDAEKQHNTQCVIDVCGPKEIKIYERPNDRMVKTFTFDQVFGSSTKQVDVYKRVVSPLIEEVLSGYSCTVFAYGQTGTGKTHTMIGEKAAVGSTSAWQSDPHAGMIPRAIGHLIDELRMMDAEFTIRVSFLELYNEELCDLLSPVDDSNKLRLYEDPTKKGSVIINGLEEVIVRSKNEVYEIMDRGHRKRQTAATLMNANSSRSHTVFSVTVHIKEAAVDEDELLKIGKLNLVDLAGSENIGRSGATEKRAREAGNINQSLLTLGRVITALVERAPHVPYRESKLTRLLQESLGGRTKTSIIATISPSLSDIEETLSTLEYAHRAKNIQNRPEINQKMSKYQLLKEYAEEIDRLKRDLLACRERNGVFIALENYNEMTQLLEHNRQEINEKLQLIKVLEQEKSNKEELCNTLKMKLKHEEEKLDTTKSVLKDAAEIVEQQFQREQILSEQAHDLLAVTKVSTSDASKLHDKLDRKRHIEEENYRVTQEFRSKLHSETLLLQGNVTNFVRDMTDWFMEMKRSLDNNMQRRNTELMTLSEKCVSFAEFLNGTFQDWNKEFLEQESSVQHCLKDIHETMKTGATTEINSLKCFLSDIFQSLVEKQKCAISQQKIENEKFAELMTQKVQKDLTTLQEFIRMQQESMVQLADSFVSHMNLIQQESRKGFDDSESSTAARRSFHEKFISDMRQLMEFYENESRKDIIASETEGTNFKKIIQCAEMAVAETGLHVKEEQEKLAKHSHENESCIVETEDLVKDYLKKVDNNVSKIEEIHGEEEVSVKRLISTTSDAWLNHNDITEKQLTQMSGCLHEIKKQHIHNTQVCAEQFHSFGEGCKALLRDQQNENSQYVDQNCAILETRSLKASNWGMETSSSIKKLETDFDELLAERILQDKPTGQTPQRKEFTYPTCLIKTSPTQIREKLDIFHLTLNSSNGLDSVSEETALETDQNPNSDASASSHLNVPEEKNLRGSKIFSRSYEELGKENVHHLTPKKSASVENLKSARRKPLNTQN